MNKNKRLLLVLLIIFLAIIIFLIIKLFFTAHAQGDFPDWIVKPNGNYTGLYCGVYSSSNTMIQGGICAFEEYQLHYQLHQGYYRVKSLSGPKGIDSALRFVVFNISYEEAHSLAITEEDLLSLEIENPYEEVYFCGYDNTPQEYWDCIEETEPIFEELLTCIRNFYNLQLNSYIDNNQLEEYCTKIV